jgi:hypothetical protein
MRRLLLLALLLSAATATRAEHRVTHDFNSTIAAANIRRIIVDIPAGEVRVRNSAKNAINLSGYVRKEYDGLHERERMQRLVDEIDVEIYVNGEEAVIRRRFGPNATGWRATKLTKFQVELEVPVGTNLNFETKAGEVWLDGSFGNVDVDLRAGEIHVRTPRAAVHTLSASVRMGEVHTNLGDRTIDREGMFPGTTHYVNAQGGKSALDLHTTFGEVHVTLTP